MSKPLIRRTRRTPAPAVQHLIDAAQADDPTFYEPPFFYAGRTRMSEVPSSEPEGHDVFENDEVQGVESNEAVDPGDFIPNSNVRKSR